MMKKILSILFLAIFFTSCCSTIKAEAIIIKVVQNHDYDDCDHLYYHYKLIKYPTYTSRVYYDEEIHPTWSEGDTILVAVNKHDFEDLMNLYPEKE